MSKNKLTDLNDHLFAQLERLSDESLDDEALDKEIKRAKAMSVISKDVISNASLVLEANKMANSLGFAMPDDKKKMYGLE